MFYIVEITAPYVAHAVFACHNANDHLIQIGVVYYLIVYLFGLKFKIVIETRE